LPKERSIASADRHPFAADLTTRSSNYDAVAAERQPSISLKLTLSRCGRSLRYVHSWRGGLSDHSKMAGTGRLRATTRGSWDGAVPCRVTAQLEERCRSFTIDLTAGSCRRNS
jgi:hypothetical protein